MKITLSADARVMAETRRIAALRGTTLNQLIRDYLDELTRKDNIEPALAQLEQLWSEDTGRSQGPWTREELHNRLPIVRKNCSRGRTVSREHRPCSKGAIPVAEESI